MAEETDFVITPPVDPSKKITLPEVPRSVEGEFSETTSPLPSSGQKSDAVERAKSLIVGGVTAGAGALLGGSLGVKKSFESMQDRIAQKFADRLGQQMPTGGSPLVPTQTVEPMKPAGGTATFNYAKRFGLSDYDAAKAVDMSKSPGGAWDVMRKTAEQEDEIARLFGRSGFSQKAELQNLYVPEVRGAPLSTSMPQPKLSPLEKVSNLMARHPIVSGLTSGALGGLGVGMQGMESARKFGKGDVLGGALSTIGAVSGAAGMYPPAAPVAIPVSLVASGLAELLDAMRRDEMGMQKSQSVMK